tara:strand:- start:104 stop:385 length:282 start_codon:yes stop_codon:yes gene_type:complete
MNHEWLLIDKVGDYFYFKDIQKIADYLNLTKGQINNEINQSIKHYNKYTNRGYYIQKLYNNPALPPKTIFVLDKFIYYIDNNGEKEWGKKVEI